MRKGAKVVPVHRNKLGGMRTGNYVWKTRNPGNLGFFGVGEVWAQGLSIGALNMSDVDYGGKLTLSSKTQKILGEGNPKECNRSTIISSSEALGRKAQTWKNEPHKEKRYIC